MLNHPHPSHIHDRSPDREDGVSSSGGGGGAWSQWGRAVSGKAARLLRRTCIQDEPGLELVSPCKCTGSQAFVHRACLHHWQVQPLHQGGLMQACPLGVVPARLHGSECVPTSTGRAATVLRCARRSSIFFFISTLSRLLCFWWLA